MHPEAFEYFKRWLKPEPGHRVLEVGSLDINSTEQDLILCDLAPETEWTGIDLKKGRGVDIVVKPKKKWPFKNEHFDWVLMPEILEHDRTPPLTMKEVHRVLQFKGKVILTTAAGGRKHHNPPHYHNFWPEGIYVLMTDQDFHVDHLELFYKDVRAYGFKNPPGT